MWCLFAFSISEMTPAIYHLQLHLEGQQFISFRTTTNLNSVLNNPVVKRTMLTKFFSMNKTNQAAIELNLLYKEFPEHFVWSTRDKVWTRRKQEATEKSDLFACDNNLVECMSEATDYQMSYILRHLFATLLVYCNPVNPRTVVEI
ncbi:hypothetical protein H5410_064280 [Solanum commersonii]|uniref:Uncharacterized protein n=1 Tax=Solanum commersonii TaxID=4109 RepID=A0A9J5VZZ9_SOLCO|nr:hypothetical protein H5410_064280 [Solanum commersonii]